MKRKIFILLIILLPLQCYSQSLYIEKYYPLIHEAELSFLDSTYQKGVNLYKKAFKIVSHPFADDYFNAAVCASKIKDTTFIIQCFSQLALRGVIIEYLKKTSPYRVVASTKKWYDFEKYEYNKLRDIYKSTTNFKLINILIDLFEKDQNMIKNKYYGGFNYEEQHHNNIMILDSIIDIYGFPSEKMIGVGDSTQQLQIQILNILYNGFAKTYKNNKFSDIIKKASVNGDLPSNLAISYLHLLHPHRDYGLPYIFKVVIDTTLIEKKGVREKVNKWVYFNSNDYSSVKEIDSLRKEIGCDTYINSKKKTIYSFTNKDTFRCINFDSIAIFECKDEYSAESLLIDTVLLKNKEGL